MNKTGRTLICILVGIVFLFLGGWMSYTARMRNKAAKDQIKEIMRKADPH